MRWDQLLGSQIGNTAINPAWATGGCIAGATYCRQADVALVQYVAGATSDSVFAQSSTIGTGNSSGNQTVGTFFKSYITQAGSRMRGQTVYKTGYHSGTTYGSVVNSCVVSNPDRSFIRV